MVEEKTTFLPKQGKAQKQKKRRYRKFCELKDSFTQMEFHPSIHKKSMEGWLCYKALEGR